MPKKEAINSLLVGFFVRFALARITDENKFTQIQRKFGILLIMYAVAFTGNSNSGKTTLIEKLSLLLSPTKRVAIIKHDPKDKAIWDTPGKDSDRFYKSGADIAVLGNTQSVLRFHKSLEITQIKSFFATYDYLFVEGLKELPLPRICVARGHFDSRFLPFIQAIATDSSLQNIPPNIALLDINNPQSILQWIHQNLQEI